MKYLLVAVLLVVAIAAPADDLLSLVNDARMREGGSEALARFFPLAQLGVWINRQMLERNESGHWGGMPHRWDWLAKNRIYFEFYGEAVILGDGEPGYRFTPEQLIDSFRGSQEHWDLLMNPRFTHGSYSIIWDEETGRTAASIILLER